jgi:hypothetical protein
LYDFSCSIFTGDGVFFKLGTITSFLLGIFSDFTDLVVDLFPEELVFDFLDLVDLLPGDCVPLLGEIAIDFPEDDVGLLLRPELLRLELLRLGPLRLREIAFDFRTSRLLIVFLGLLRLALLRLPLLRLPLLRLGLLSLALLRLGLLSLGLLRLGLLPSNATPYVSHFPITLALRLASTSTAHTLAPSSGAHPDL